MFSDWGPKMAWMQSPAWTTAVAPRAFSRSVATWPGSATVTRSRVMQASRPVMLWRPPKASTSSLENWSFSTGTMAAAASSSSRPGVLRWKKLIDQVNRK